MKLFTKHCGYIQRLIIPLAILIISENVLGQDTFYKRGLTDHFTQWLGQNKNYYPYHFNRTDFFGGSFGGKEDDSTQITRRPVIFIHGAADQIIGEEWANNGFRYSIEYFLEHGYSKAELYGSMWGYNDLDYEHNLIHDVEWILQIRKFIEAVLEYTGAEQVDIICHSMGVTLSRGAIKGGFYDISKNQPVYVGEPLTKRVRSYIAIAGGNYGVTFCIMQVYNQNYRLCNKENGLYPGSKDSNGPYPKDISRYLKRLLDDPTREAQHTYAMYSLYDQTNPTDYVFSRLTSEYPTMDKSIVFGSPQEYDHCQSRDLTADIQYALINDQPIPNSDKYIIRVNEHAKNQSDNNTIEINGKISTEQVQNFLI
eukprot:403362179